MPIDLREQDLIWHTSYVQGCNLGNGHQPTSSAGCFLRAVVHSGAAVGGQARALCFLLFPAGFGLSFWRVALLIHQEATVPGPSHRFSSSGLHSPGWLSAAVTRVLRLRVPLCGVWLIHIVETDFSEAQTWPWLTVLAGSLSEPTWHPYVPLKRGGAAHRFTFV